MKVRDTLLAGVGWCCLLSFIAALLAGHGKNAVDYAQRLLKPLPAGQPLGYADRDHAIWSGWQIPSTSGYRLTNAATPDVVFRYPTAGRDCDVIVKGFPLLAEGQQYQRLYVALNGSSLSEPALVRSEGIFRLAKVGDIVDGINTLTLRLLDAGRARPADEHVLALGLRSIEFVCQGQ